MLLQSYAKSNVSILKALKVIFSKDIKRVQVEDSTVKERYTKQRIK